MGYRTDIGKWHHSRGYPSGLPEDVSERLERVVRAVDWIRDLHYKPGIQLTSAAVIEGIHELAQATDELGYDWLIALDLQTLVDGAIQLADSVVEELEGLPDWAA